MQNILFLIFIISLFLFIIGLISPKTSLWWYRKKKTRILSIKIYGGLFFLTPMIAAILFPNKPVTILQPVKKKEVTTNNLVVRDTTRIETVKPNVYIANPYLQSDSICSLAKFNLEKKNFKKAINQIDVALKLSPENSDAKYRKALAYQGLGQYRKSIDILENIGSFSGIPNDEILLNKGTCLLKLGKTVDALYTLKEASRFGSAEADYLLNKVNPTIKVIIGYTTRCCDGWASSAKGRGACSHHGGVCDWNEPIYEERKKYNVE